MESLISWIVGLVVSLVGVIKTFVETKKLLDERVAPDLKAEETAKQIEEKQELAHSLIMLTTIEATYNIARGLLLALQFSVVMHYNIPQKLDRPIR
jgi:hypothetical protein